MELARILKPTEASSWTSSPISWSTSFSYEVWSTSVFRSIGCQVYNPPFLNLWQDTEKEVAKYQERGGENIERSGKNDWQHGQFAWIDSCIGFLCSEGEKRNSTEGKRNISRGEIIITVAPSVSTSLPIFCNSHKYRFFIFFNYLWLLFVVYLSVHSDSRKYFDMYHR